MTKTQAKWAARVAAWRTSGQTAPEFCQGKEFSPGGLRYWSSRLGRGDVGGEVRMARVIRAAPVLEPRVSPIVVEVGGARVAVPRGFDPEALRAVLAVLGEARCRPSGSLAPERGSCSAYAITAFNSANFDRCSFVIVAKPPRTRARTGGSPEAGITSGRARARTYPHRMRLTGCSGAVGDGTTSGPQDEGSTMRAGFRD
jgi:transposase